MKLSYFSRAFVKRLGEEAARGDGYQPNAEWLDRLANGRMVVFETNLVVGPPPQLRIDAHNNPQCDGENAVRVFKWLETLGPALAMEERLWAYLTHSVFADYMAARWPVAGEGQIRRRYMFEGGSATALARNGIARLWWGAFLTRDNARRDPFELTKTLFMVQDIQVSLLERSLGKCQVVRTAVLDFLRLNQDWLSSANFGRRIQLLLRDVNMLGGVALLDTLPPSTLNTFLRERGAAIAADC